MSVDKPSISEENQERVVGRSEVDRFRLDVKNVGGIFKPVDSLDPDPSISRLSLKSGHDLLLEFRRSQ